MVVPWSEASSLLDMVRARIRRLSHLEDSNPETFSEVSRLARICYILCKRESGESVVLGRMSREDVEAVYVLDLQGRAQTTLQELNRVRMQVRSVPVDPDASDQAVKSVYEVMET